MSETADVTTAAIVSGILTERRPNQQTLLHSIVTMARAVFDAAACSIMLLDQAEEELVFEAVAGHGEELLVGTRFPAHRGIAGWVAASGEPTTVTDLDDNDLFARDLAESTGYVPSSLMAVPLLADGEPIGVMEVLDPVPRTGSEMAELDLLMRIADQATLSLDDLIRVRTARGATSVGEVDLRGIAALVRILRGRQTQDRSAGIRLVEALVDVLSVNDDGASIPVAPRITR